MLENVLLTVEITLGHAIGTVGLLVLGMLAILGYKIFQLNDIRHTPEEFHR